MKRMLIVALLCLNVCLLAALLLGTGAQPAKAQAVRGAADYLMISTHMGNKDTQGPVLVDLGRRRMIAFKFNQTTKKMQRFATNRDLRGDFRAVSE